MKKYKCIKPFCIPEIDVYGNETGNDIEIKVGTVYELNEHWAIRFGEARLYSIDGTSWMVISNEILKKCFEEVKVVQND